jgi:hypothetical protein
MPQGYEEYTHGERFDPLGVCAFGIAVVDFMY